MAHLTGLRHPRYTLDAHNFHKWRLCYEGGEAFRDRYLSKFSDKESPSDFARRKSRTPIPAFAGAAIREIGQSLFQHMPDVIRMSGSQLYQSCTRGEGLGVDRKGTSMNAFIGQKVLEELLVMGLVGIYVDAPRLDTMGPLTLANTQVQPYLYHYRREDILSWKLAPLEHESEFESVLLRDHVEEYDNQFGLPCGVGTRLRHIFINPETGRVNVHYYESGADLGAGTASSDSLTADKLVPKEVFETQLTRIPFVLLDIHNSLMKNVADHQITLLNLESSATSYAMLSNLPWYTEQRDPRYTGSHLNNSTTGQDGSSEESGGKNEIETGTMIGRYYDQGLDRPGFIAPPTDNLVANMQYMDRLENGIRRLVSLAVAKLGASPVSGASRGFEREGLEAGLSFIASVLQTSESKLAAHWAAYEETDETKRQVAKVDYPARFTLKTTTERIEEASQLSKLIDRVPSRTAKKELANVMATQLLAGKVSLDTLNQIQTEIKQARYTTSDPDTLILFKEHNFAGAATLSEAAGFPRDEADIAREEHIERVRQIQAAQTSNNVTPVSGVPDTQPDPQLFEQQRQEQRTETDTQGTTRSRTRGRGRRNRNSE